MNSSALTAVNSATFQATSSKVIPKSRAIKHESLSKLRLCFFYVDHKRGTRPFKFGFDASKCGPAVWNSALPTMPHPLPGP